jgi:hypothetical protein
LITIQHEDLEILENEIIIKVKGIKTNNETKRFIIKNLESVKKIKSYLQMFTTELKIGRLLKHVRKRENDKGIKVVNIPIGINFIQKSCQRLAKYLGKEHPENFTSHCMRRSAATTLANNNISMSLLQCAGDWKSSNIATGYIQSSDNTKRIISNFFEDKENKQEFKKEIAPKEDFKKEIAPKKDFKKEIAPKKDFKKEIAPKKDLKKEIAPKKDLKLIKKRKKSTEDSKKNFSSKIGPLIKKRKKSTNNQQSSSIKNLISASSNSLTYPSSLTNKNKLKINENTRFFINENYKQILDENIPEGK